MLFESFKLKPVYGNVKYLVSSARTLRDCDIVLLQTTFVWIPTWCTWFFFMPPCVVLPVFASLIMNQMRDVVLTFLFLLYAVFQTFSCMWCIGAKQTNKRSKKILNCRYLCAGAPLYSSLYSHVYSYIPEDNVHSDAILTTSTWLTAVVRFWAMYRDAFEAFLLFLHKHRELTMTEKGVRLTLMLLGCLKTDIQH